MSRYFQMDTDVVVRPTALVIDDNAMVNRPNCTQCQQYRSQLANVRNTEPNATDERTSVVQSVRVLPRNPAPDPVDSILDNEYCVKREPISDASSTGLNSVTHCATDSNIGVPALTDVNIKVEFVPNIEESIHDDVSDVEVMAGNVVPATNNKSKEDALPPQRCASERPADVRETSVDIRCRPLKVVVKRLTETDFLAAENVRCGTRPKRKRNRNLLNKLPPEKRQSTDDRRCRSVRVVVKRFEDDLPLSVLQNSLRNGRKRRSSNVIRRNSVHDIMLKPVVMLKKLDKDDLYDAVGSTTNWTRQTRYITRRRHTMFFC